MKRLTALAAVTLALGTLGTAAAGTATAAKPTPPPSIPADCTVSSPAWRTTTLTCTGRPADQQWRLYIQLCFGGWGDTDAYGTVVTGNGTSTAVCPQNAPHANGPVFQLV